MAQDRHRNIVIIGGGIIGCTTAYYLTRHPLYSPSTTSITVMEASAHGIAQGASGKAGGLIAKWAFPSKIVDISFPEHVKLANEHDGKERWGWRFVNCGSWEGRGEDLAHHVAAEVRTGGTLEKKAGLEIAHDIVPRGHESSHPDDLNWVKEHLTRSYRSMSAPDGTAQVHPYLFTTSMMDLAAERGATLLRGSATAVEQEDGHVTGVRYNDPSDDSSKVIPATHVVLSAGAWSRSLVPSLHVSAIRAHSVTIRPNLNVTIAPYVLFTEIALPGGKAATPEIYARPDNEIYSCGATDDLPLPMNVDDVEVDQAACQSIWDHVASISTQFREGTWEKRQACYLPVVGNGEGPVVGEAQVIAQGLYIATGHTCWGICNAPGTAKVITELIMHGRNRSLNKNVRSFEPSHFLQNAHGM